MQLLFLRLLDKESIDYCLNAKNLGIIFDTELNWSDHVSKLISKIYDGLSMLRNSKLFTPKKLGHVWPNHFWFMFSPMAAYSSWNAHRTLGIN